MLLSLYQFNDRQINHLMSKNHDQKSALQIQRQKVSSINKHIMTIQKRNNSLTKLITLLIVMCYLAVTTHNTQPDNEFLIVLKNDKLSSLTYNPNYGLQHRYSALIYIHNDQQSITVEMPIGDKHDLKEQYLSNHTQHLPLWRDLLKTKGYLKPYNPFDPKSTLMIKGYRYTKPAYHDTTVHQVYEQISAYIKALVQTNNLTALNLRMEDTFMLKIFISPNFDQLQQFDIAGITIKYLFTTVSKDQIPQKLLMKPEWVSRNKDELQVKIVSHNEYAKENKFITLERKLFGRGLHQWVNHTLSINDVADIELQGLVSQCWYEFTDILPESTYIDSDQRRQETTNYEVIDIERPAFASKQYFYKFRVALTQVRESGVRKYCYTQPVHFRYPSPSLLNYTKVYLHSIFDARIVCNNNEQNSQESNSNNQIVYIVEQNLLYERGTASIPNADISKAKIVSITSLVVCLIAALVIINKLKNN